MRFHRMQRGGRSMDSVPSFFILPNDIIAHRDDAQFKNTEIMPQVGAQFGKETVSFTAWGHINSDRDGQALNLTSPGYYNSIDEKYG